MFPVSLGGRSYIVDMSLDRTHPYAFRRESVSAIRDQQTTNDLAGEQTISKEDLWRRAQESWEAGAGQSVLDRDGSEPKRYRTSKGINPWDKWKLTLLSDTDQKRSSANTNIQLIVAGNYLYVSDGNELYWTADITVGSPTWTSANVSGPITSLTTDGKYVYIATGTSIKRTLRGSAVTTTYSMLDADIVGYVKGRLMAADGFRLYNILSGSTQTELTPSDFNDDWTWTAFGDGPGSIYAAGFAGDKSKIYRVTITPEGTKLGAPIMAGEVPDGEIVRSLASYLGSVLIGTGNGVRLALAEGGFLIVGPLISTTRSVQCFEAQDRFVWFGWSNFDATSTGLGRVDLLTFTQPLTPAYASDLMATAQGDVSSVITFQDRRVFSVQGAGVFCQDTDLVPEGYLDSGLITYGLPDAKVLLATELRHEPLAGAVELDISADGGDFEPVFTSTTQDQRASGDTAIDPIAVIETLEARLILSRAADEPTFGPILTRYTLKSQPTPRKADIVVLPLMLHSELSHDGGTVSQDPEKEFDFLKELERSGSPVEYHEGKRAYQVVVDDVAFYPARFHSGFWDGLAVVRLKLFV